jgi:hypothetical protein
MPAMGSGTTLGIVGVVGIAVFGGALRQAFQALEAKRYRSMWAWYSWAFLSSGIFGLVWAANGDPSVLARNIILGVAGAALGGSVAIWAGYAVHDMAAYSQQPTPGASMSDESKQPSSTPNQSGNFNSNQQGGVTNQTYINQAPEKLKFTDALGAELLARLPKDKPITIRAVGSQSDQMVGIQIANFLKSNGYHIMIGLYGGISPPPDHPLTWNAIALELTVAPSVR